MEDDSYVIGRTLVGGAIEGSYGDNAKGAMAALVFLSR